MRRRLMLLLAPFALASTLVIAAPGTALASNGMIETGTTTYEVLPAQAQIKVTISISIANRKPSDSQYYYFWNSTQIAVEKEAGAISATSNAGKVKQKALKQDDYYRYVELDYPDVLYGQTRVVTATYAIPAAPKSPGGYRALSAYASLCAVGNGEDTGSVSIVVPAGFDLYVDSGSELTESTAKDGRLVYSTGTQSAPYKLWTCVDAENEAKLTQSPFSAGTQPFTLKSWPEDKAWSAQMQAEVTTDVPALEDLTGLTMPGARVTIVEAGDAQLGQYAGMYNADAKISYIPETIDKATVAHELSHIWFNGKMLADKWMSEGLAGYSEQAAGPGNFTACAEPGAYPTSSGPNLLSWKILSAQPTIQDEAVVDYNYRAACYVFTTLASQMGPDNFRNVITAASTDMLAYQGATAGEKLDDGDGPLTSKEMLDLIDEFGMLPAGVKDLDAAGDVFARYGIIDSSDLTARSTARTKYHALAASAGKWAMPLAVRDPMATWSFASATTAMTTIGQILDARKQIESAVEGLSLDGTQIQKDFEAATTQTDLEAVLALAKKEADAADVVARAVSLNGSSRSLTETVGLLGVDVDTQLTAARTDLAGVKPETAKSQAQSVIDTIDASGGQGTTRIAMAVGGTLVLLLLIALVVLLWRRGRKPVPAAATFAGQLPGFGPMPGTGAMPGYPARCRAIRLSSSITGPRRPAGASLRCPRSRSLRNGRPRPARGSGSSRLSGRPPRGRCRRTSRLSGRPRGRCRGSSRLSGRPRPGPNGRRRTTRSHGRPRRSAPPGTRLYARNPTRLGRSIRMVRFPPRMGRSRPSPAARKRGVGRAGKG